MKFIVTSIGTRGDMEPLLAIGEILKEEGHEVTCLFPEQFRHLAEDTGLQFASLGTAFIEMLNSPAGQTAMGGGPLNWKKIKAYASLIKRQQKINKDMILKQEEVIETIQPDKIVHNGKVMYPVLWGLDKPNRTTLVSPVPYMHYVKDHSHVAFNKNLGPFLNKLTYDLANFGLVKTIYSSVKWLAGDRKVRQKDIQKALFENQCIYTISPSLFQRPDYWPDNRQVLGYHERKKTNHWKPSEELEEFIHSKDKILFVTFGSMLNQNPEQKTEVILKILKKNNIPAIINTAAGGLIKPEGFEDSDVFFVEQIPYDWVFSKVYAVMHHGGSGTTHTALKYGCASMIIPHIIDQYVWNKIIHSKGFGPLGKEVSKIKISNLELLVLDLWNNPKYKESAQKAGHTMSRENYREKLISQLLKF
ncbi:glycosyltransferase [Jiulongibacter sp. NS-SX5]|uniref:glycosyltransferase n=1 Tax=Jiulongibacter sp. NS-SX5 TaxID=3463854 RepID=UPI004058B0C3